MSRDGVRCHVRCLWVLCAFAAMTPHGAGAHAGDDDGADRAALVAAFQDVQIVPKTGGFLLMPGEFPELQWEQPYLVENLWGEFPLRVRWFDAQGNDVREAAKPGRYGAYIEGTTRDGMVIRRARTFFCIDPTAAAAMLAGPEFEWPPLPLPLSDVPQAAQEAHHKHLNDFVRLAVLQAMARDDDVAILAASLAEWHQGDATASLPLTPALRNQRYHLAIKRRVLGVEDAYPPLYRPLPRDEPAPTLRCGTPAEAGFQDLLPRRLQAFCEGWHREAGGAFTLVVARNGVVVFHEAFGEYKGQPATRDTAYPLFSLTKTVTGLMLSQFLDQGLLELDAPLGRVLPDLPVEGPNVVTLRKCLMHVTGLQGHGNWKGLDNPWLDNVIANGIDTVPPAYRYSGVAYDLAGMAMSLVAGKSVPQLFHEHLFEPLAMRNASITGLGAGAELRAVDLARLGQVILNAGAYGKHTFFSPQTLDQFLPQPYEAHYPGFAPKELDYGLGIRVASEPHPRAGSEGIAPDAVVIGPRTIGHGAFSGTVFRVDLDTNTIVVAGRFSSGENHGRYVRELLALVADAIGQDKP